MESIWYKDEKRVSFPTLERDTKTDVLIIGGGIAGILCACFLEREGVEYILVEADRILRGVSGNTTAKITIQHGLIYDNIIRKYGLSAARLYLKAHQDALQNYDNICKKIDCDYKTTDAFVYSTGNINAIEREAAAYEAVGLKYEFCERLQVPIKIKAALKIEGQAQFNPVKFCRFIAERLNIYENTKVLEVYNDGALINRGKIAAKKIIVATHFPFINKHGSYFIKMYQHRSYVIALENAPLPDGMYVDADIKGLSFREYNGLCFLGGGSHRTGKKGGAWQELRRFAKQHYKDSKEVAFWATQDCMTLDSLAYIGQYSKMTPNLYVATGFNKWGITTSMAAAKILTDMILQRENDCAEIFSPSRSILHKQLAINAAETFINMITPTAPRCPHLGCALKYNAAEHTWDCPCHGSRFKESGKLIENPATDDMKY